MKAIYKFFWDCGRQGYVEGMFIADVEMIEDSIGKQVYFGEILGKHSKIYGDLDKEDLTIKTDDQEFIEKFEEIMGKNFCIGYNPLHYIREEDG